MSHCSKDHGQCHSGLLVRVAPRRGYRCRLGRRPLYCYITSLKLKEVTSKAIPKEGSRDGATFQKAGHECSDSMVSILWHPLGGYSEFSVAGCINNSATPLLMISNHCEDDGILVPEIKVLYVLNTSTKCMWDRIFDI